MISETFSSMLLNPVHIHQSFDHAALRMRGKILHNQNKETFHQPGYLMIDKFNVFKKLHRAGFSYKIQLDHRFQPLSSLRCRNALPVCIQVICLLLTALQRNWPFQHTTKKSQRVITANTLWVKAMGYVCVCVCICLGWGRTLWNYPHTLQQRLGETDLH